MVRAQTLSSWSTSSSSSSLAVYQTLPPHSLPDSSRLPQSLSSWSTSSSLVQLAGIAQPNCLESPSPLLPRGSRWPNQAKESILENPFRTSSCSSCCRRSPPWPSRNQPRIQTRNHAVCLSATSQHHEQESQSMPIDPDHPSIPPSQDHPGIPPSQDHPGIPPSQPPPFEGGYQEGSRSWNHKYLLVLAYDGSRYSGWQRQKGTDTVQSEVEATLFRITRQPIEKMGLIAAGRTDAGVHAAGQAAHFVTDRPLLNLSRTLYALNSVLPKTVRVKRLMPVSPEFHARYHAVSKTYHYSVCNAPVHDVFGFRSTYFYGLGRLDREAMAMAALGFVGVHNFAAFANASEVKERDPVRHITRFDLVEHDEKNFRFEVEGTGFLYKQVRNMVGLLLQVGRGEQDPSIVSQVLESQDRRRLALLAPCARPQGLTLHQVHYPPQFFSESSSSDMCHGLDFPDMELVREHSIK